MQKRLRFFRGNSTALTHPNTHPLDSVGHLPPSCIIHQHRIAYPSIEAGGHWVWLMPSIAVNLELLRVM
ncbi:MAG: hypothetical protein JRJ27_14310 [Deltaproteobacteria bacterium]|nr:hypothetical protein [Deltaproteobacteria bacterium]